MYILPTLTYLEVGVPAAASEISIFEPFNYEPIRPLPAQPGAPSSTTCTTVAVPALFFFLMVRLTSEPDDAVAGGAIGCLFRPTR